MGNFPTLYWKNQIVLMYQVWCNEKEIQTGRNAGKKIFFSGVSPHLGSVNIFAGTYKSGKNKGKKYMIVTFSDGNKLLSSPKKQITETISKSIEIE